MRPRLLLIGTAYAIREHRKKLDYLASAFDITCVTARRCGGFGWTESADDAPPEKWRLIGLPHFGDQSSSTRFIYRGLVQIFRGSRFDLVFVENEPWGWLRWQVWLLKTLFQPTSRFGEFSWENAERAGWKRMVLRQVYRAAARTADFVIPGNQGAAELLRRAGFSKERICVAPQFGVDPSLFVPLGHDAKLEHRTRMGFTSGSFLVGFCGRLVPEKGIRELVAAFRSVRASVPAAELLLVGTGPLEAEIRSIGEPLMTGIRLIPPATYPEISEILQALDVLVLPSKSLANKNFFWREQFGHILIEAMSCGVASIGSDSGAIPEVLGDTSVIFPEGDVASLADMLLLFASDPAAAAVTGVLQRVRVQELFTHERVAERWSEIFRRTLKF